MIDQERYLSVIWGPRRGLAGRGIGPFFEAGYGICINFQAGYGMRKLSGTRDCHIFRGGIRDYQRFFGGMRDTKRKSGILERKSGQG